MLKQRSADSTSKMLGQPIQNKEIAVLDVMELMENDKIKVLESFDEVFFSVALFDGEELVFAGKTNRNPHLLAYTKKGVFVKTG